MHISKMYLYFKVAKRAAAVMWCFASVASRVYGKSEGASHYIELPAISSEQGIIHIPSYPSSIIRT